MEPILFAMDEYGTGRARRNVRVKDYFDSVEGMEYSKVANWCGIFMNFCAKENGYKRPIHPGVARNWLKVGRKVPLDSPKLGDVIILWRRDPDSWMGHVGFFVNYHDRNKRVHILGGNQHGGKVCISSYACDRILGIRRLQKI